MNRNDKILILKCISILLANLGLAWVSLQIFQSSEPMLAGLSLLIHVVLLTIFPYQTFFKTKHEN